MVKVVNSNPCGWGSIPGKSCSFFIVSLSKSLSLCFMCSDQHVKYWMPRGFPSTSSLLLDYHVKQYTHTPHGVTHVTWCHSPTYGVTHLTYCVTHLTSRVTHLTYRVTVIMWCHLLQILCHSPQCSVIHLWFYPFSYTKMLLLI